MSRNIALSTQLGEIDLENLVTLAQERDSSPISAYGGDALTVFHFAVRSHKSGQTDKAAECGRWAFNVCDALAMARDRSHLIDASGDERLKANRSVQRELRKQDADLTQLERIPALDSRTATILRGESARLGRRLLQEIHFTAETEPR